jgi:MFS family permease
MGSLMIGPIVSGSVALNVGWRNFWWLNVALGAFVLIYIVFLFPETKFVTRPTCPLRPPADEN